jgi:hypothetical protein
VTITLDVTADKPNRITDGGYFQYFFQGHGITIPRHATDLTITDTSGRALDHEIEYEDEFFLGVLFDFGGAIFYRQTATVVIRFNLVEDRDNKYSLVRVNDAYIGLDVWTDPFLEAASVEVVTPPGFVISDPYQTGGEPGPFRAEVGENEMRFVATDVDPEDFWAVLSLKRPERLDQTNLEVAGHEIHLQFWPGDRVWSEQAGESIEEGLPLLLDAVGLDWPLDGALTVTESFDPTLAGYGGWYDPAAGEISVGDVLDDHLMMHELSHVWFGERLFSERWITEGLANIYAAEVVEDMGENRPAPETVSLLDDAALPLRQWNRRNTDQEVEAWAYPASWTVTEAILAEVGEDTMDVVVAAAYHREMSYLGDAGGDAEVNTAALTWKRYLDLLENRSGDVVNEDLQELFVDWVSSEANPALIDTRNEHRERYFALTDAGDTWAPPLGLRDTMARWDFTTAEAQMDDAEAVLDRRDLLIDDLAPVEVELPAELEERYESATGPALMLLTNELLDRTETAAEQLVVAHESLADATGLLQQIGALGADYDADLAAAAMSFTDGDFDSVARRTDALDTEIDGLARQGMLRAVVTGLAVVALVGGLLFLVGRRRHRTPPFKPDSDPEPEPIQPTVIGD